MVENVYEDRTKITAQIELIAKRLWEEREQQRISQMDLSFKAGLSQNQVNYIETGKRIPNLHTLLSLCSALQINPAVLFKTETRKGSKRQKARETIIRLVSRYM